MSAPPALRLAAGGPDTHGGGIEGNAGAVAALEQLYCAHYDGLVRLSALLLHDVAAAEEVVQDAFVAMHDAWARLRHEDAALAYLRHTVLNRSRSLLRRRKTAATLLPHQRAPGPEENAESADVRVLQMLEHEAVIAALRSLPLRQREALVLRYYADLSEAEIAEAMGVSRGSVKVHISRGMTALRTVLTSQDREPQ